MIKTTMTLTTISSKLVQKGKNVEKLRGSKIFAICMRYSPNTIQATEVYKTLMMQLVLDNQNNLQRIEDVSVQQELWSTIRRQTIREIIGAQLNELGFAIATKDINEITRKLPTTQTSSTNTPRDVLSISAIVIPAIQQEDALSRLLYNLIYIDGCPEDDLLDILSKSNILPKEKIAQTYTAVMSKLSYLENYFE